MEATGEGVALEVPPRSIEEVLAGAMWVASLTDPALCLERLHDTFNEVIFSCVEEEDVNEERVGRFKTAADRLREQKVKEELRRELMELQNNTYVDDAEEEEGRMGGDDDDDDDNEDYMEESHLMDDEEFLSWIHRNDTQRHEQRAELLGADETAADNVFRGVELELHRVGLGEEDRRIAEDPLPERLKAIEVRERRPALGSRLLPHGYSYKIPLEYEAFWILRQLRSAGQPLAHNTRICAIATRPLAEVADEPVVVAIVYAVRKMTQEYLEPAHLMLYHQTALHPLLCALIEDSPFLEAAESSLPVPSYAYSTETGRRQRPHVKDAYVGFDALADRSIGEGDSAWNRLDSGAGTDFAQRKPCFVELGRLLVRILELDVLCHRLESHRQQLLLKLKDHPESSVQEQRVTLEALVFESGVEADLWQTFASFLTANHGRGPTQMVKALGLEEAFEEYTITGLQYQENLVSNAPIHVCQSSQSMQLMDWARQVGTTARSPRSAEEVLYLFNQAIVEQFSKLPILRKRLFDVFCAEGDLIVTYRHCDRKDDIFSLATFFVEHPRHYLDLLERERQGTVGLYYVLNEDLVRREMNLRQLYDRSSTSDEWYLERERATDLLLVRLINGLIPKVKTELSQFAHQFVQSQAVERLALICAQGPYEPTRLCLDAYDDDALTWEPEWNVVEALPLKRMDNPGRAFPRRVCAAYRADNGMTYISFIDETGFLMGSLRWTDCALSSENGRAADLMQQNQLEKLCVRCNPSVIIVGASNIACLSLMRSLLRFLRERVHTSFHVHIPIVWAPVEVARLYNSTTYAELETPGEDPLARTSMALGRYVQDPLNAICVLFDKERTALRLSLGATAYITSEQEDQLYTRLCWEMSLWVTACGMWVEDCITRPTSVASLQFLAGFGPSRARKLHQLLMSHRPSSRKECDRIITESFGAYVSINATSSLRVGPPSDAIISEGSLSSSFSPWHLLDQTLIPKEWYSAAAFVARSALENIPSRRVALVDFMQLETSEKRQCIDSHARPKDMIAKFREAHCAEWDSLLGKREVEFLQDEMIAAGRSFLRRPYRRLSKRELMTCLTGLVYCTQEDGYSVTHSIGTRSLIICEGDYVTGTVQGVRGGGVVPGIRISTSFGLGAFIAAEDIDDGIMKQDLIVYEQGLRQNLDAAQPLSTLSLTSPTWLRRGAPIQGILFGCNWERCELRLRWCRPRDAVAPNGVSGDGSKSNTTCSKKIDVDDDHHYVSYAVCVNDGANSVNSLRTALMTADARVFATKISRHPLFRDITSATAHSYLYDKKIGEVILRPATGRRNKAIAVVKIGERSMCNWLISEERRSTGAIYYQLKDKVTGRELEFGDVDEFLNNFITPMVLLVQGIRNHRRFVESSRDVQDALDAQRQNGLGFTYVFAEVGQQSKPPFYRVFTRCSSTERNFYLHIDDNSVYVRVPIRRTDSRGSVDVKWVKCHNAEHVSEVVKGLARPR